MLPTLHQTVIPGRHLPFVLLPHANRPSEHTSVEVQPAMRRMDSNLWQRRWRCWPPQAVAAVQAPSHQAAASPGCSRFRRTHALATAASAAAWLYISSSTAVLTLPPSSARCVAGLLNVPVPPPSLLMGCRAPPTPASLPPSHHRRIVPTSDPNHAPRRTAA
jgi:hypothetical protein